MTSGGIQRIRSHSVLTFLISWRTNTHYKIVCRYLSLTPPNKYFTNLRCPLSTMSRCQFFIYFFQIDLAHTGDNIGKWLMDSCTCVECESSLICINIVYGARNSGKLMGIFWSDTNNERSSIIFASECDAHQIKTAGKKASGTSLHKFNLDPELGKSIALL